MSRPFSLLQLAGLYLVAVDVAQLNDRDGAKLAEQYTKLKSDLAAFIESNKQLQAADASLENLSIDDGITIFHVSSIITDES